MSSNTNSLWCAGIKSIQPDKWMISNLFSSFLYSLEAVDIRWRKLKTTEITDWLLAKEFLEKQITPDGKSRRVPTESGLRIGLSTQIRQGQYGEYQAVFYNAEAQQFVLDNLFVMLEEK